MGQQQLLLIVLGVIVTGVAISMGITLFNANSRERNKESIVLEMRDIGADIAAYSLKPQIMGGGGGNISTYRIAASGPWGTDNDEATYTLSSISANAITVTARSKLTNGAFVLCTFDRTGKITAGPFSNGFGG